MQPRQAPGPCPRPQSSQDLDQRAVKGQRAAGAGGGAGGAGLPEQQAEGETAGEPVVGPNAPITPNTPITPTAATATTTAGAAEDAEDQSRTG